MSYDTSRDTITVDDITYDVERESTDLGYKLTIEEFPGLEGYVGMEEHDHEHCDPRDWSNVGTMAVSYGRYRLGDEEIKDIDFEVDCETCEGAGYLPGNSDDAEDDDCVKCEGRGTRTLSTFAYFSQQRGARVVLPLSVYEHSGITMFVGHKDHTFDPGGWDTSYVGFIFDTPEKVKECIGDDATDEQIEAALRAEVKVYASWLEGDVTWYSVQDEETNYQEGCGGYVGDSDYCESECFDAMETAIVKRLAENKEREHWNSRDTITQ